MKTSTRIAILTVYEVESDSAEAAASVAEDLARIRGGEAIGGSGYDVKLGAYTYKPVSRRLADMGEP